MGTTAEKLNYLKETKTKIKNALETPSSIFRDYSSLIKKYIDNQPVKIVSDGICNNAADLPTKTINVAGNSKQNATNGYQLFNWNGVSTPAIATYEDEVAKLTWTNDFDVFFLNNTEQYLNDLNTSKEYTISFKHKGNAIKISNYTASQYNVITDNDNDYIKYSFTVTGVSSVRLGTIRSDASGTAYIKELMVYEGTEDKIYEPYTGGIPAPNPENPQKIEVINSIGLEQSGKNEFDNTVQPQMVSGAKATTIEKGKRIELTGKTYSYVVFKIKKNISKYAGKTVRFKADFSKSNASLNPKYGIFLADDNYSTGRILKGESTISGYTITFNLPEIFENEKEYLFLRFYGTVEKEGNIGDYVDFNNVILTIDNKDMTYEPYHEPIITPINLQGNTLAKVGDIKDKLKIYRNGNIEIEKNVGKYVFTGNEELYNLTYNRVSALIPNDYKKVANSNVPNLLSNCYKSVARNKSDTNNSVSFLSTEDENFGTILCDILHNNKDSMRSFLKSNYENGTPIYILYELATPQTIKLSPITPIELWQGTNIFKLITNLDTTFEVEYVVDKESILNEVQTAMLEAEIEI